MDKIPFQAYYLHVKPSDDAAEDVRHLEGVWRFDMSHSYSYNRASDTAIARFIQLSRMNASDFDIVASLNPPSLHIDVDESSLEPDETPEDRGVTRISKYVSNSLFSEDSLLTTNYWHKIVESIPKSVMSAVEQESAAREDFDFEGAFWDVESPMPLSIPG